MSILELYIYPQVNHNFRLCFNCQNTKVLRKMSRYMSAPHTCQVCAQKKRKRKYNKLHPEKRRKENTHRIKRAKVQQQFTDYFKPELKKVYKNTPINNQVDHIIPLLHKNICGLHVPWNLQYLSSSENNYKNNSWDGTYENLGWKNVNTISRK